LPFLARLPDLSGPLRVVATADSTAWQGAVLQTALKHTLTCGAMPYRGPRLLLRGAIRQPHITHIG